MSDSGSDLLALDLHEMLAAVRIVSDRRFTVGREVFEVEDPEGETAEDDVDLSVDRALPPHLWRRGENGSEEPPKVRAVESALYRRLYTRDEGALPPADDPFQRRSFVHRLSEANRGRGTWDPGWRVHAHGDDGTLHVVQGHSVFRARPEWVRTDGDAPAPGDRCRVWIEKEQTEALPGFYLALGNADAAESTARSGPIVRLYWHLTAAGAAPFLEALTTRFNAAGIPFRCKVLRAPGAYVRADGGVLYLDPGVTESAWKELGPLHREVAGGLRPAVPRCTFALAPGLGVAEDPDNGQSFGQHRCRLVSRALWRAFDEGAEGPNGRAELLAAEFRAAGLEPLRPHLGPGSREVYPPLPSRSVPSTAVHRDTDRRDTVHKPSFLEAAARIGDLLSRSAYRHAERCNWVGHSQREPALVALGPTLYSGTAGIGWFLARLHQAIGERTTGEGATDEPALRETALGAARQALRALRDGVSGDRPPTPLGLYAGKLGALWAARETGLLLGAPELIEPAERDLTRLVESLDGDHDLDVVSGCAGAVPVLLALHRETAHDPFLHAAVRLGEELCATAMEQEVGWAWDPERVDRRVAGLADPALDRPWTGLSHGAAGMGLALFEIHAATGREDFLEKAVGAFAYEDSLLDREAGNWQDTRSSGTPRFSTYWCHGAPGIVLARLRAAELHPEAAKKYLASARIGLATTRSALETALESPEADTSLCHGLCGLAEVLLTAARQLGEEDYEAAARNALARLLEYHGTEEPWPSGAPSRGSNPSLMLGMAGVGHTLLRLHDPDGTLSVLWVMRSRF